MSGSTIIVTGSNGQLGSELKELAFSYPNFHFVFLGKEELPLNDSSAIEKLFSENLPSYLINCAAYTAVDKAERERETANAINGKAVGYLASVCKEHQCKFIHISTDYVFSGEQSGPLKETDPVDPVNAYGKSKLLGEKLAMQNHPDSIIIRTSWVYSSYGKNFVKTMIRLMSENESMGVVNDQYGSPTYAADLAEAVMKIISSGNWKPGIYHFSNEGNISWFDFAGEIKRLIQSNCIINPLTTDQYPTPAKRPHYSVLDKTKIQQTFSVQLKDWKESLRICIEKINRRIN